MTGSAGSLPMNLNAGADCRVPSPSRGGLGWGWFLLRLPPKTIPLLTSPLKGEGSPGSWTQFGRTTGDCSLSPRERESNRRTRNTASRSPACLAGLACRACCRVSKCRTGQAAARIVTVNVGMNLRNPLLLANQCSNVSTFRERLFV